MLKDIGIIGGGIAGMATAARLQASGFSTIVFEAHGQPGGCAGFFRKKGFSFDVGATTLVDFEPGGVGGELLAAIGLAALEGELLPGYVAWLPDTKITLYRNSQLWQQERLRVFGDSAASVRFWQLLDRLAQVFWRASRAGVKLPIQNPAEAIANLKTLGFSNWPLLRYLNWTMGDALRTYGLADNRALRGLLAMLIEDTVHSSVEQAPLINAALGITIRSAGLTRASGGMYGFWRNLVAHYRKLGGELRVGCRVEKIEGSKGKFTIVTQRGNFQVGQLVSALPANLTAQLSPPTVAGKLGPYLERDKQSYGGAIVVFLGVPENEVADQTFTHHQILQNYDDRLGNGNNMFISVSAPNDTLSAPPGYRAVMISTHCELTDWQNLTAPEYNLKKQAIGTKLLELARRVYPNLGRQAVIYSVGTPASYARFTGRLQGAVGGVRQTLANSNQHALPHASGLAGFWLVGDSTWPGLGTVACVLGSRIVADKIKRETLPQVRPVVFPLLTEGSSYDY